MRSQQTFLEDLCVHVGPLNFPAVAVVDSSFSRIEGLCVPSVFDLVVSEPGRAQPSMMNSEIILKLWRTTISRTQS